MLDAPASDAKHAAPQPAPTGEVHRQVIVDGTYFNSWCILIAHNGEYVIGWQWCDKESKAAWAQLFKRFPAPDVVVTDGGTGLRAALVSSGSAPGSSAAISISMPR